MYDILNRSHEAWVAELNKFAHHCFGCLGDCTGLYYSFGWSVKFDLDATDF